jgi:hypothetical protein
MTEAEQAFSLVLSLFGPILNHGNVGITLITTALLLCLLFLSSPHPPNLDAPMADWIVLGYGLSRSLEVLFAAPNQYAYSIAIVSTLSVLTYGTVRVGAHVGKFSHIAAYVSIFGGFYALVGLLGFSSALDTYKEVFGVNTSLFKLQVSTVLNENGRLFSFMLYGVAALLNVNLVTNSILRKQVAQILLHVTCALLCLFCVLLSGSKALLLSVGGGLLAIVILALHHKSHVVKRVLLVSCLPLSALVVLGIIGLEARSRALTPLYFFSQNSQSISAHNRWLSAKAEGIAALQHPLIGNGIGDPRLLTPSLRDDRHFRGSAFNIAIELIYQQGITGFLLYLGLLLSVWSSIKKEWSRSVETMSLISVTPLIVFFVTYTSFDSHVLSDPNAGPFIAGISGLIVSVTCAG